MMKIENLHVSINDKPVLNGINLTIKPGEVHAIMGPNASGKSTLSKVIAGHPDYQQTKGTISFEGQDLADLTADERARLGIFLALQYPTEIPGVSNVSFLKAAVNVISKARNKPEYDAMDFLNLVRTKMAEVKMEESLLYRGVNEGFSGGEKKRNEILQMLLLEPKLAVLDETDSGLDIDALQVVAKGVNSLRSPERSFLLITHYQRLLGYIKPDFVHVLAHGKLIKTGGPELALELEDKGYAWIDDLERKGRA